MEQGPVPPRVRGGEGEVLGVVEDEGFVAFQNDIEPTARQMAARRHHRGPTEERCVFRPCWAKRRDHRRMKSCPARRNTPPGASLASFDRATFSVHPT